MAHNVSIPLTRWHARPAGPSCAYNRSKHPLYGTCLHLPKVNSAHLRSPSTPVVEFCTRNAHAQRESAPLKMHR
jgi:hypothetical protein